MANKELNDVKKSIDSQIKNVETITGLLSIRLFDMLNNNHDPRARVGTAELIQSYAQLQRVLLDLKKTLVDLPEKELVLLKKEKEINILDKSSEEINLFALQQVLHRLGIRVGMSQSTGPFTSSTSSRPEQISTKIATTYEEDIKDE